MSIAKVVETISEGPTVEDAVQNALDDMSKTVRNIQSIYVRDIRAPVENGEITGYRVNCKVTFVVDG